MPAVPPCTAVSRRVALCSLVKKLVQKRPGWECGMLWGPGALLWGHCKIMMYIARLHW